MYSERHLPDLHGISSLGLTRDKGSIPVIRRVVLVRDNLDGKPCRGVWGGEDRRDTVVEMRREISNGRCLQGCPEQSMSKERTRGQRAYRKGSEVGSGSTCSGSDVSYVSGHAMRWVLGARYVDVRTRLRWSNRKLVRDRGSQNRSTCCSPSSPSPLGFETRAASLTIDW